MVMPIIMVMPIAMVIAHHYQNLWKVQNMEVLVSAKIQIQLTVIIYIKLTEIRAQTLVNINSLRQQVCLNLHTLTLIAAQPQIII